MTKAAKLIRITYIALLALASGIFGARADSFTPEQIEWGGEFGRTPFAQGSNGRDHNPFGFTIWLAGGGVKGGTISGATDDYGYKAVENKVSIHDLHATMLHLPGLDHTRLTFRFSGRDMRLTDVYGEVMKGILA